MATPASLKYASLCVLCLQNSLLAILMRLSRVGDHARFNTSTAVVMGEVFKLITAVAVLVRFPPREPGQSDGGGGSNTNANASGSDRNGGKSRTLAASMRVIFNQYELLRISVPALLYVIQNNLQYIAVSNLDAAAFQVLYQLKILTTAIFSVILLRKAILPMQWCAIALLMVGVSLVQLDDSTPAQPASGAANVATTVAPAGGEQNTTIGLLAVLAACMCSGFAGVYFERILKHSTGQTTLWERNIQMGIISLVVGTIGLWYNDYDHLMLRGFFYGYRPVVWAAISVSAFGGLLTAVVVKYADNILKAFATSIAIVLSVIVSIFLFDKIPTLQFLVGATIVNGSVYMYGRAPAWNAAKLTHQSSLLPRIASKKLAP